MILSYSLKSIIFLLLSLIFIGIDAQSSQNTSSSKIRQRLSNKFNEIRNRTATFRHPSIKDESNSNEEQITVESPRKEPVKTSVVVLTSLSGIYVWWPVIFGGDDSFHLLLNQEDVPRFHDVTGDDHGNIYLTAPHERKVYQLKYSDGWWISNFSNHSVMNSIRSELPLFVNMHHISSILYVYGHSDVQVIDLLERPRLRGSAPFMKRLRELSPSLRLSDMIIDQVTSEGYIIGDSYGWCTVIRCSLTVNNCVFLFKIPSSYDNRPYPCTATIDFSSKIIYLSLEDKILAVSLNEQTHYDQRFVLSEKRGIRSTLGYDDIIMHGSVLLYTDVLRPILHLCTSPITKSCLNLSLVFSSNQKTIFPLRIAVIDVVDLHLPTVDIEQENDDERIDQISLTTIPTPLALIGSNRTRNNLSKSNIHIELNLSTIILLFFGVILGLLLAALSFIIYYLICSKNRPRLKRETTETASTKFLINGEKKLKNDNEKNPESNLSGFSSLSTNFLNDSDTENSSETIARTDSSRSYRPETYL